MPWLCVGALTAVAIRKAAAATIACTRMVSRHPMLLRSAAVSGRKDRAGERAEEGQAHDCALGCVGGGADRRGLGDVVEAQRGDHAAAGGLLEDRE